MMTSDALGFRLGLTGGRKFELLTVHTSVTSDAPENRR